MCTVDFVSIHQSLMIESEQILNAWRRFLKFLHGVSRRSVRQHTGAARE
jgi:hypothetical protein